MSEMRKFIDVVQKPNERTYDPDQSVLDAITDTISHVGVDFDVVRKSEISTGSIDHAYNSGTRLM